MNRLGYKVLSDSTLMLLSKKEIIEQLRVAEHNFFAADEALDRSIEAGKKLAEEKAQLEEKYQKVQDLINFIRQKIGGE